MKNLLHKVLTVIVPFIVSVIVRIWFFTCRIKIFNEHYLEEAKCSKRPLIGSFWHYSLMGVFYVMRKERAVAMVSASKDGDYIAGLARHFGFDVARGSRNRRGAGALKEMLRYIKKGGNGAAVADGSVGPPLVVQPGVILLASKVKGMIVPVGLAVDRYYVFNSWDRTIVPKPFSNISVCFGKPIYVEEELDKKEIEEHRKLLEERLNDLYKTAWNKYGKDKH